MTASRMFQAALAALLGVASWAWPSPSLAADRFVDYLYVEANEGSASGGHVALRLGGDVFHFEHRRPDILVLQRAPLGDFLREYAGLENRTIEASRIPVSDETFRRLRDRFRRMHVVQRRQLGALAALGTERRIIEELLQGRMTLDGAGLFRREGSNSEEEGSGSGSALSDGAAASDPVLVTLRQRVLDAYGADFFTQRIEALRKRLAALDPLAGMAHAPTDPGKPVTTVGTEAGAVSPDRAPPPDYGFAARYRDTLTALTALDVLAGARPLASGTTITTSGDELRLRDDEPRVIAKMSDALAASLVRLVDSRRPDWGFALLLGMARLAALEASRASGRWVFVDAFPSDPDVIERERVAKHPDVIGAMLRDARADLAAARARVASWTGDVVERDIADLEDAGNRFAEIRRGLDDGRDVRGADRLGSPGRTGTRPAVLAPPRDVLTTALTAATEREALYGAAIERRYRYQVVTHNCVSELFREMDAVLLGARAGPDDALSFIPAMSTVAVRERYAVSEVIRIPSERRAGLARLYDAEHPVAVFLRESNTLTSTLYRQNEHDSLFVFFTDDVVLTRPVFGALNLITGVTATAVGLVAAPFDGGKILKAGARGVVFSLPELFFQNIRKGSYEYLDRETDETRVHLAR